MNKTVWGVILVVVIAGAVGLMFKQTGSPKKGKAYYDQYEKMIKVYDVDAKSEVEMKQGKFNECKIDAASGYRIGSGGRKLTKAFTSAATGEKVPPPPLPVNGTPEELLEIRKNYKDEASGKSHYPEEELLAP